ncbi:MAG: FecR domain-containing protein [Treponema sp.]|jgi:hypothetical protein|nr:FecR domain-containing protein [Treponema sp.]
MKKLVVLLLVLSGPLLFAQEALILEVNGTVEILRPGETVWQTAQAGQRMSRDTGISTGFKSMARISLGNSTIFVRALTRLTLEELQNIAGEESVELYLQTGHIRTEVAPPLHGITEFRIISPMVTASVRGTTFEFDGLNLQVDEGRVLMRGGDGAPGYVGAGRRAESDPWTGRITGAAETTKAEITRLPAASGEGIPASPVIIPRTFDTAALGVDVTWN